MKAKRNKAIIRVILAVVLCMPMLFAIKASASSGNDDPSPDWDDYPYTNTSYLTPGGNRVNCRNYSSATLSEEDRKTVENADQSAIAYDRLGVITRLADPSVRYNCYSYAFYSRNTATNTYVIMQTSGDFTTEGQPLYAYLNDPHFVAGIQGPREARVGDIVLYYSSVNRRIVCHAAVVSEVNSNNEVTKVISKWGMSCLYEHGIEDVPRQYRVTLDTQNYGTVYYEVHGFYIHHSYGDWSSISSSQHQKSCNLAGCTKTKTGSHAITYSKFNSSKHYRQCTACDYKATQSHSNSYESISSTQHRCVCDKCSYTVTQSHSNSYTSISDTQHRRKCSQCGNTATVSHTFGPWKNDGVAGHSHTCSVCSKKIVQAHIFNGTSCKICGYDGPGVAAIRALMQKYPHLME